jgi:hypothetical protein
VANLSDAGGDSRLNGNAFLKSSGPDTTAFDDAAADVLTGGGGLDWCFAKLHQDQLKDPSPREYNQPL